MNKLKIQSTVNPDKRYSFNEWIAKVMEAKENISHLQSPIIRERAAQRWNERNKRYYNS